MPDELRPDEDLQRRVNDATAPWVGRMIASAFALIVAMLVLGLVIEPLFARNSPVFIAILAAVMSALFALLAVSIVGVFVAAARVSREYTRSRTLPVARTGARRRAMHV